MKFLLDANMPRSSLAVLRDARHHADHVRDLGLGDATDVAIDAHAQLSAAIIVTRDLDFSDVRKFAPESRPGLLVLRAHDACTARDIADMLARFLELTELVEQIPGHLVILESDRVRFRPAIRS